MPEATRAVGALFLLPIDYVINIHIRTVTRKYYKTCIQSPESTTRPAYSHQKVLQDLHTVTRKHYKTCIQSPESTTKPAYSHQKALQNLHTVTRKHYKTCIQCKLRLPSIAKEIYDTVRRRGYCNTHLPLGTPVNYLKPPLHIT
nr:hypothetical protein BgiMline_022366 [Biomphalaria glabrata]